MRHIPAALDPGDHKLAFYDPPRRGATPTDAVARSSAPARRAYAEGSDPEHRDVRVIGREPSDVVRIMRDHDATTEPDGRRHDEGVDGQLAARAGVGQEVPRDARHPDPGRHDLGEPPGQDTIDRLVGPTAPIQLHQHRRRDANRSVAPMGASHRHPDPLMTVQVLPGMCQGGDGLGVEN